MLLMHTVSLSGKLSFVTAFSRRLHVTPIVASPSLTVRHFAPQTKRRPPRCNVAPRDVAPPRRVAVVGAGLAGLSVVYHLLHSVDRYARKRGFDPHSMHITVFDPAEPGTGGASAAAAGLLHEFRPRPRSKMWEHQKAIDGALHLIAKAQCAVSEEERQQRQTRLLTTPGILKLAFDEKAEADFRIAAGRFPSEVEYLSAQDIQARFPPSTTTSTATTTAKETPTAGLLIKRGHVVDTPAYMRALWDACRQSGRVTWSQRAVSSVAELFDPSTSSVATDPECPPFDNVVLCAGAALKRFSDLPDVPLSLCLGHNLVMDNENADSGQGTALMAGTYIVPQPNQSGRIIAGATREFKFDENDDVQWDTDKIKHSLADRLLRLDSTLYNSRKVTAIQHGVRALPPYSRQGTVPLVCQVKGTPPNRWCWLFTAMGSKGLIYHAFLGRRLAHAIVAGNESLIPGEARRLDIEMKTQVFL